MGAVVFFLIIIILLLFAVTNSFDKESFTPAPNEYQNNDYGSRNVVRGALPFSGRGKTHTDWVILAASKLPSVGDHNIHLADQSE